MAASPLPSGSYLDLYRQLVESAAGAECDTPATHKIPVDLYTSQSHFDHEMETVFANRPLVIGHESQIAQPGDAIVHEWLGLPLVTVRDKSNQIHTFLNVCRHRNMRLVQASGPAQLKSFVCPYHQWTYGLDGQLRNIPLENSFVGIDKKDLGLVELPTEIRHGLIWVLAKVGGSMDVDKFTADLAPDFDAFGLADAHYFTQSVRQVKANWKLIQDAFLDGYHVIRLHKDTVGGFFLDCVSNSNFAGEHIRSVVGRKEVLNSKPVPDDEAYIRAHVTYSYTLFPNTVVVMHPDYTSVMNLYPVSPDETIFVHSMLVPEPVTSEKQRQHYERSFDLIDHGVFYSEDLFVCEGAQQGMRSGANTGLLCGQNEQSLVRFHETMFDAMGLEANFSVDV